MGMIQSTIPIVIEHILCLICLLSFGIPRFNNPDQF